MEQWKRAGRWGVGILSLLVGLNVLFTGRYSDGTYMGEGIVAYIAGVSFVICGMTFFFPSTGGKKRRDEDPSSDGVDDPKL